MDPTNAPKKVRAPLIFDLNIILVELLLSWIYQRDNPVSSECSPISFLISNPFLPNISFAFAMSAPITIPPGRGVPDFASSTPPSSLWNRISTWASENKAVVYTVAGVAIVVTGAGVAYYLTDSVSINHGLPMDEQS